MPIHLQIKQVKVYAIIQIHANISLMHAQTPPSARERGSGEYGCFLGFVDGVMYCINVVSTEAWESQ